MANTYPVTPRTELHRRAMRAVYDRVAVHAILDEGFVCHVGFSVGGLPFVLPTGYARNGERLYIHGSAASRMLRNLAEGIDVCVTVTLIDGFVLARSAFHHSLNYRSVVVFGRAQLVTDPAEKFEALRAFTNHLVPGRWDEVRPPTELELKGTSVLSLLLEEVSAKVRTGPPLDDERDGYLPVWAGVIPVCMKAEAPIADKGVLAGVLPFDSVRVERSRSGPG